MENKFSKGQRVRSFSGMEGTVVNYCFDPNNLIYVYAVQVKGKFFNIAEEELESV